MSTATFAEQSSMAVTTTLADGIISTLETGIVISSFTVPSSPVVPSTTPTITNLGPLTERFEPASDCFLPSMTYLQRQTVGEGSSRSLEWSIPYGYECTELDDSWGFNWTRVTSCLPDRYESMQDEVATADSLAHIPLFSRANVCPGGWEMACTFVRASSDPEPTGEVDQLLWSELNDGQTMSACCPIDYECGQADEQAAAFIPRACLSVEQVPTSLDANCGQGGTALIDTDAATITHYATQILMIDTEHQTNPPDEPDDRPPDGAPSARTLALAITIPIGAIALGLLTWFFWVKRWRSRSRKSVRDEYMSQVHEDDGKGETKPELEADVGRASPTGPDGVMYLKPELHDIATYEAYFRHGNIQAAELTSEGIHEMQSQDYPSQRSPAVIHEIPDSQLFAADLAQRDKTSPSACWERQSASSGKSSVESGTEVADEAATIPTPSNAEATGSDPLVNASDRVQGNISLLRAEHSALQQQINEKNEVPPTDDSGSRSAAIAELRAQQVALRRLLLEQRERLEFLEREDGT